MPSSILAIIPKGAARVGRLKFLRLDRCFSSFATEGTEFFFSGWFWCCRCCMKGLERSGREELHF